MATAVNAGKNIFFKVALSNTIVSALIKDFFEKYIRRNYCYVPQYGYWPKPREQVGPCCGIYALAILLENYKKPHAPRKIGRNITSLRQIAKELKLSTTGEIFSITSFQTICQHLDIHEGKAIISNPSSYIQSIIQELHQDKLVITSCDSDNVGFLASKKGKHPHWIIIFGYFIHRNKIYFLITQNNYYCVFSAEELLYNNQQIPSDNPTKIVINQKIKISDIGEKFSTRHSYTVRRVKETSLTSFRLTSFSLPNRIACAQYTGNAALFLANCSIDRLPFDKSPYP